jgi:replicative DNA helicase
MVDTGATTRPATSDAHLMPPQSIEAEASIISAVLLDNSTLNDVLEILKPEDFYRTAHQKIFSAIGDLFARSEPADLVTVSNRLKEAGHLESVGGAAYLARIIDEAPLAVNAQHYARIVQEKATLRRLIEKSNAIARRCFEQQGETEEILDFAENAIFEIAEHKSKKSLYPLGELVVQNFDTLEKRAANKSLLTGIPSGFNELDRKTSGFQNSDLVILAARPAMGKTSLALNIARNAAVDENVPVAIFSLEMSREQLSMRLLCAEARVDSSRVRSGMFYEEDWRKLTDAAGVLSEAPIYIDDAPDISTTTIRTKSRRLKMDKGLGMIVVDYLQLMRPRVPSERRDLEISEVSRSLKALAKELDIPIIALSQLNRMLEQRSDKRPVLSDLRESGALEQDADLVLFIYRDEVYNKEEVNPNRGKAEVILSKHRNGPIGTVYLTFLNQYTRFENMAMVETV